MRVAFRNCFARSRWLCWYATMKGSRLIIPMNVSPNDTKPKITPVIIEKFPDKNSARATTATANQIDQYSFTDISFSSGWGTPDFVSFFALLHLSCATGMPIQNAAEIALRTFWGVQKLAYQQLLPRQISQSQVGVPPEKS